MIYCMNGLLHPLMTIDDILSIDQDMIKVAY